ncbi:MAG: Fe-S cluster assembly protein SufD [Halieaceae bacterium]|jgi:Fe-S cluster assembly protein SufD|nr:Fe-S cluster assembly protein SufD [Halieaceae bacterium]
MSEFTQQLLVESDGPAWLAPLRERGRARWTGTDRPTRKTEDWKYTSLQPLDRSFAPAPADTSFDTAQLPDLGGPRLLFIDGRLQGDTRTLDLPEGVKLVRFAEADAAQADTIKAHLGSAIVSDRHVFASLNDATLNDGLFLHLSANAVMREPLHIVYASSGAEPAFTVNQRLLVVLDANAQGQLVEHYTGQAVAAFTNGITELLLGPGAKLSHQRLHCEEAGAMHIGGLHARLDRDSHLDSFHLALGSDLKRIDLVVHHAGSGAHCDLNGIYLLRGKEHVDYHSTIEHAVPHCTTDEVFRGVVGDEASAVFNGRIHIHPDAQKTRAELSNKNLLTSNNAEINTKPELEIYADDVQCAHGATVAQLDEGMLHYLRTRGVHRDEAEVMLSYGFINELVENLDNEALRNFLHPLLAKRLSRDPELIRHLT